MSVSVIRHERIGGDDCGDVCVCAGWERGGGQNVWNGGDLVMWGLEMEEISLPKQPQNTYLLL